MEFILKKKNKTLFKKIKLLPILGSESFAKTVTEKYLNEKKNSNDNSTQKQLLPKRKAGFIIKEVAKHYHVDTNKIKTITSRKQGNEYRATAIYLSCLLSDQKMAEIAVEFTGISSNGIAKTYQRIKEKLAVNKNLNNKIETLKCKILKIHTNTTTTF